MKSKNNNVKNKRKTNNKNMESVPQRERGRERPKENENVEQNVMGKNFPQHTFMRNRKLANRFLFSLQDEWLAWREQSGGARE